MSVQKYEIHCTCQVFLYKNYMLFAHFFHDCGDLSFFSVLGAFIFIFTPVACHIFRHLREGNLVPKKVASKKG